MSSGGSGGGPRPRPAACRAHTKIEFQRTWVPKRGPCDHVGSSQNQKISEVLSKSGSIGIEAVVASLDLHLRRYRTGGGWPCRVGIQG